MCLFCQQEELKRKDKERKKAEKDAQQVCVARNIIICILTFNPGQYSSSVSRHPVKTMKNIGTVSSWFAEKTPFFGGRIGVNVSLIRLLLLTIERICPVQ